MALEYIQQVMDECMSDLSAGKITACEGYNLRRAINARISILRKEFLA